LTTRNSLVPITGFSRRDVAGVVTTISRLQSYIGVIAGPGAPQRYCRDWSIDKKAWIALLDTL